MFFENLRAIFIKKNGDESLNINNELINNKILANLNSGKEPDDTLKYYFEKYRDFLGEKTDDFIIADAFCLGLFLGFLKRDFSDKYDDKEHVVNFIKENSLTFLRVEKQLSSLTKEADEIIKIKEESVQFFKSFNYEESVFPEVIYWAFFMGVSSATKCKPFILQLPSRTKSSI